MSNHRTAGKGRLGDALERHLGSEDQGSAQSADHEGRSTADHLGEVVEASPARPGSEAEDVCKNDKGQAYVANGEFGRVVEVAEKYTVVEFSNPHRRCRIPRGTAKRDKASESEDQDDSTGCDLDLGYAVTCHRMQGSEVKVSIVALDEYPGATGKFGVAKREWLYTAISRAKECCFLVGKIGTAMTMCRTAALPFRKTFLVERIGEERGKLQKPVIHVPEEESAGNVGDAIHAALTTSIPTA